MPNPSTHYFQISGCNYHFTLPYCTYFGCVQKYHHFIQTRKSLDIFSPAQPLTCYSHNIGAHLINTAGVSVGSFVNEFDLVSTC